MKHLIHLHERLTNISLVNKQLITALLFFVIGLSAYTQGGRMMHEKIKTQKVAFITEKLDLTTQEAQNFWPIYNAYEDKMHQLRRSDMKQIRVRMKDRNLSESDAQKVLNDYMTLEEKMHDAKKELVKDLKKVIPAKKIINLKAAEDAFNRKLMETLRENRQKRMKKNRP